MLPGTHSTEETDLTWQKCNKLELRYLLRTICFTVLSLRISFSSLLQLGQWRAIATETMNMRCQSLLTLATESSKNFLFLSYLIYSSQYSTALERRRTLTSWPTPTKLSFSMFSQQEQFIITWRTLLRILWKQNDKNMHLFFMKWITRNKAATINT